MGPAADPAPDSYELAPAADRPTAHAEKPTAHEEGPRYLFDLPAPTRPVWLDKLTLLLLVPLIAGGGNPLVVVLLAMQAAQSVMWLEPWMAVTMGISLVTVPSFAGLALLFHRSASYRRVIVDDDGFVFGKTPKWRGTRVRWGEVEGFRIFSSGLMLKLRRKPWTRWLGPIVHTEDRETHELVVALEEREIYRLGDG